MIALLQMKIHEGTYMCFLEKQHSSNVIHFGNAVFVSHITSMHDFTCEDKGSLIVQLYCTKLVGTK